MRPVVYLKFRYSLNFVPNRLNVKSECWKVLSYDKKLFLNESKVYISRIVFFSLTCEERPGDRSTMPFKQNNAFSNAYVNMT